jgi:parvulin-like peptidyl-prolyl isomerase
MIVGSKYVFVVVCIAILMASCSSKAKKSRETQETIERINQEHEALLLKQQKEAGTIDDQLSARREDGIAARVNEEVILFSDLEDAAPELFRETRSKGTGSEAERQLQDARRDVLDRMIEKKLLEQEAERREINVSDEEVKASFDQMIQKKGLTEEAFLVQLAHKRMTLEQFKEKLRREIKVYKLIDMEINRHLHVSDEQCEIYFKEHQNEYVNVTPEGFRLQQIVLMTRGNMSQDQREERRLQIEQIRERIISGEDFGALAREYSEGPNAEKGGDCGFFKEGELLEELDRVASGLEVGELSPVIETSIGFHLIRVIERENGGGKPPEGVKEKIRNQLKQQAYQQELMKLLESLKESAYIDIRM